MTIRPHYQQPDGARVVGGPLEFACMPRAHEFVRLADGLYQVASVQHTPGAEWSADVHLTRVEVLELPSRRDAGHS